MPGAPHSTSPEDWLCLLTAGGLADRLVHTETHPARDAVTAPLPDWLNPQVEAALAGAGIDQLWSHQAEVAEHAHAGRHTVVATGTASGKSLAYLLPVLSALADGAHHVTGRGATALYLAPTKALAQDQLAAVERWMVPGIRAAVVDGDTPTEERTWARQHANYVLTNPDLVHHSLLPGHERWRAFLRRLHYVVVDECHVHRGVPGAHVALVLRRLLRIARRYGTEPTVLLASATVADPADHASRLLDAPVQAVTQDGSPRGEVTYALWDPQPEAGDDRPSTLTEAARISARLIAAGRQVLTFTTSRVGAEVTARVVADQLEFTGAGRGTGAEGDVRAEGRARPAGAPAIAAYRGGYLPEERRAIERGLRDGTLRGVAATTALELGIDVSGLDAVVMAGWPGRRASFWQQAGRAGRSGQPALAVLVAGDNPLDHYLVHHPEGIFSGALEATVVDPSNPRVLAEHLACAAAELPLQETDSLWFGPGTATVRDSLVRAGMLRERPTGWYWAGSERPHGLVDLRGMAGTLQLLESRTGRVLGTIDAGRADSTVHTGAVYLHQGTTHVVTELDLDDGVATVVEGDPGWITRAVTEVAFDITAVRDRAPGDGVEWSVGDVLVRTRVTAFRRQLPSGEVLGQHPLDLPERTMPTQSVWFTLTPEVLADAGVDEVELPGALHAAEHALIGMLGLVATCDRWDVGGVSTPLHPDTGLPTVMVHDGHPGGAGFADRGFAARRPWVEATLDAVRRCPCDAGCPACVQSPKCGNNNEPLSKEGAVRVLQVLAAQWSAQ
ncbi:DEAD/DEAH box helicase [Kytococcus sedentarius]|uniref:DEAD/DEAH box helicase n=1 Tax=Kytococcus sedentarius TaxID=1276 RepID=UPI00387A30DD